MTQQRRRAGSKGRWFDHRRPSDEGFDPAYEYRTKPGSKPLPPMPERAFFQVRIDDEPAPGYTTSVEVRHTSKGPRISFVGLGLTPAPLEDAEDFPWFTSVPPAGQNEGGISAEILKSLSLTRIRKAISEELASMSGYDDVAIGMAAERIVEEMGRTRRQTRTPKFLAELAVAYVDAVNKTGGYLVYEELGERMNYAPETLRSYVKQLREEGYLTPGARGIAGGDLTDKSTEILRAEGLL
jgi:hypothetical protein